MFYSVDFLRTIAQDGSLSDSSGIYLTGLGVFSMYRSFGNKDQTVGTSREYHFAEN